jgi:hypothetical protein
MYSLWRCGEILISPRSFPPSWQRWLGSVYVGGHDVSQELAAIWISEGIDSVVFPSTTGTGRNIVVYLSNAAADSVQVRNRAEFWQPYASQGWGRVAGSISL